MSSERRLTLLSAASRHAHLRSDQSGPSPDASGCVCTGVSAGDIAVPAATRNATTFVALHTCAFWEIAVAPQTFRTA